MLIGVTMRVSYGRTAPLWFDETFTGVIAGQAGPGGLWHWLRTELTGPFFYAPLWAWARFAGVSDTALRLPSLVWTLLAPLLVLWCGHRDATLRWSWAVLLLLWLSAAPLAADARPYALLLLLGTLQVAAFAVLLRTPGRHTALRWTAVTTAIGLTHYLALVPGLVQGVMLLIVHRRVALRLWPAAMPLLLLAGWMAVHLRFVLAVGGKGAAACTTLGWAGLARLPDLMVGGGALAALLAVLVAVDVAGRRWQAPLRHDADAWTALAGVLGLALIVAIAGVVPGFALRYFTAAMPGPIFAAAWWLAGAWRRGAPAGLAAIAVAMLAACSLTAATRHDAGLDQRHAFELERPSAWLLERQVDRVVFLWADSTAELALRSLDGNLAEVGGFFLARAGRHPTVELVHAPDHGDAAAALIARAGDAPRTAILWLGNTPSADPRRRPDLLFRQPGWVCRDWGEGLAVAVACRQATHP